MQTVGSMGRYVAMGEIVGGRRARPSMRICDGAPLHLGRFDSGFDGTVGARHSRWRQQMTDAPLFEPRRAHPQPFDRAGFLPASSQMMTSRY